ncbi:Uncharacterised protein [Shigella boydii]|uniref:Uncharacterized protein n=2 Tax=Shigella boydii TaxID=621 RepID=A0A2X2HMT8_SHIBO|nr:Uncharacterised protein [Shigella boydii]
MLQIMLFLIHTRYKYQKHKPDKYLGDAANLLI